jgi:integrase
MPDYTPIFDRLQHEKGLLCSYQPSQNATAKHVIGECSLHGHRINLYAPPKGTISYRYTFPGAADDEAERARTGVRTAEDAFVWADGFLREKATLALRAGLPSSEPVGLEQATTTIKHAYDYIRANFRKRYPREKQWREILKILLLTEKLWTGERLYTSLSGSDIALYIGVRTEQGMMLPKEFSRRPALKPCKLATAVNDLLMLSAVFKKLQSEVDSITGQMPFKVNPFAWLLLPDVDKALRDKPTPERFDTLMRYVDRVDPSGQLRLALVIARWLGRRIGAISALARVDLRFTTAEMLQTIQLIARRGHRAHDGVQSVSFAYEFLMGAIFFDRDRDKKSYQRLVPMSTVIREEVDLYLERNPDLDPAGPLFPSEGDPRLPTSVPKFIELLHAAEELARAEGHERAIPPLYDSVFHGFRGLRASELENHQHRPAHVAFLVGWSCKMGNAKDDRYVMHDARLLYAAVQGMRPVEIEAEYQQATSALEAENAKLREQNTELSARLAQMMEQNAGLARQLDRMGVQMERMEQVLSRLSPT